MHTVIPSVGVLFPYLTDFWKEYITQSDFKGPVEATYPKNAPTTIRPDARRTDGIVPGSKLAVVGSGSGFPTDGSRASCRVPMLDLCGSFLSLRPMQIKFSKSVAVVFAGIISTGAAFAHPGHAPTDVVAEVSQPLAGVDHLVAFLALTSVLLLALRLVVKVRHARRSSNQPAVQPIRRRR